MLHSHLAANNLGVDALFVYTNSGHMASLLSRCRPDCPIFAFTTTTSLRRRLNLQWGLIPFRLSFSDDMESNLNRTFCLLKARGMIKSGDLVIAVSDMLQSIQVMNVPWGRIGLHSHQPDIAVHLSIAMVFWSVMAALMKFMSGFLLLQEISNVFTVRSKTPELMCYLSRGIAKLVTFWLLFVVLWWDVK